LSKLESKFSQEQPIAFFTLMLKDTIWVNPTTPDKNINLSYFTMKSKESNRKLYFAA